MFWDGIYVQCIDVQWMGFHWFMWMESDSQINAKNAESSFFNVVFEISLIKSVFNKVETSAGLKNNSLRGA